MTPDLFDRVSIAERYAATTPENALQHLLDARYIGLPEPAGTFTRRGDSIVPPTADELARQRRDAGIQRAAQHAQRVDPQWQDQAVALVRWYAGFTPSFLTEAVREIGELRGLASPTDSRAWGAVMKRAAREGIVRADGWAAAKSSNLSAKRLWRSLIA